jgi:UDP-glucose 4-epimerase
MVSRPEGVLVLGAAGFLGTAVSRYCLAHGLPTVGVDIATLSEDVCFTAFHQMEQPEKDLGLIMAKYRPAYLINLAGNADVGKSLKDPRNDFRRAVDLFSVVLEQVRQHSMDTKVLLASSAAIYGQPKNLPITEGTVPDPISPYGYHKWMCELMAREYGAIYGVRTASARIFSAYGSGLRKQIFWDVCHKCRRLGSIELGGDGTESRDFIHANDIAQAMLCILRGADFVGESYNVASGRDISIYELACSVIKEFGVSPGRLKFSGASRAGDPKNWRADVSLLQSLGFKPSVDFPRGVAEYVEWFKRQ